MHFLCTTKKLKSTRITLQQLHLPRYPKETKRSRKVLLVRLFQQPKSMIRVVPLLTKENSFISTGFNCLPYYYYYFYFLLLLLYYLQLCKKFICEFCKVHQYIKDVNKIQPCISQPDHSPSLLDVCFWIFNCFFLQAEKHSK